MHENLSSIKYGDVLVAEYLDIDAKLCQRNYIIFIANGIISYRVGYSNIGAIAGLDLGGNFFVNRNGLSIGFTTWSKNDNEISIIRKPKFSEMAELIAVMKTNNFKFNRKTKNIEKL